MTVVSTRPLDGLRVIDLTTMISGNFTTAVLAEFGADVISVEHPEKHDPVRDWVPRHGGVSLWWKSLGRNKRCVTLDLSTEEGAALAMELAADADVVVENFRPGTMEGWGLGYDQLAADNEGLIMTRISGYGQTGPAADKPGFGTIAEARSGWVAQNGFPDGDPLLPPIPLADLTAAQFAVMATMFALFERDVGGSGAGQVVDVSLYEPLFRLFVGDPEAYDVDGYVPERTGNRSENSAPRNLYETADGHVVLSASAQRIFENVMAAIDRPELVDDPRFHTNEQRLAHVDELDDIIESWTREHTTETVIETLEAHDAIVGPVFDVADVFDDEQYAARENLIAVEDEDVGHVRTHAPVPKLSRTPGAVDHLGPAHGAHNEAVYLGELALDETEYEHLVDEGVI